MTSTGKPLKNRRWPGGWWPPAIVVLLVAAVLVSPMIGSAENTTDEVAFAAPALSPTAFHGESSDESITISWPAVENAAAYKIDVATDQEMANVVWSEEIDKPRVHVGELEYGTRYYYRVTSLNKLGALSAPSVTAAIQTQPQSAPVVVAYSPLGITLSWEPSKDAESYIVERSATERFGSVIQEYTVPAPYTRLSINDMESGIGAYFRVRAVTSTTTREPSPAVSATAASFGFVDVRVGTFNVMSVRYDAVTNSPWSNRRTEVAELLNEAKLDVVGLQEATAGTFAPDFEATQLGDLVSLTKPQLTESEAGFLGTQILYNAKKFAAEESGVFQLPRQHLDTRRAAVWQVLRAKENGTRFIVLNTHLTSGPGADRDVTREKQARTIIEQLNNINRDGLPVVIVGDLNSHKDRATVTPLSVLVEAGYAAAELVAVKKINGNYSTLVGEQRRSGPGTKLDHVLAADSIGTHYYEVVVGTDTAKGPDVKASDHRPVITELRIPHIG